MNIHKNDTVVVRAGRDKGKRGRIFRILPNEGLAYVEGINIVKRHMRPKPNVRQAGIIQREAPIQLSNLALMCPSCNKPTKAHVQRGSEHVQKASSQISDSGLVVGPDDQINRTDIPQGNRKKTRICKLCQAVIE